MCIRDRVRRAEIPAPSAAQPALGPDFDTLVLKALAREPGPVSYTHLTLPTSDLV